MRKAEGGKVMSFEMPKARYDLPMLKSQRYPKESRVIENAEGKESPVVRNAIGKESHVVRNAKGKESHVVRTAEG